ncbi:hypothetical protein VE04_07036 [Pseudogymnoascus sp. 24MN13]|nr:hypothetical protein VE04_07036 [Pseudogymnoascus sp. 24MN13]
MKLTVLLPVLAVAAGLADATCKFQDVGVFKQKWRLSTYKSENCINKAYDVTKSGWGPHCVNFPNNVRSFIFTVGGRDLGVDAGCTIFFNTNDNCGGSVVGRSKSHWTLSKLSAKGRTMKSAYVQCTKLLRREEGEEAGAEENQKVYIRGDDGEWYEKISDTEVVRAPELGVEEGERVVRRLVDVGAGVEERDIEADEDVEWTAEPDVEDEEVEVQKSVERGVEAEEVQEIAARDIEVEEVEEIADRGIYADEVDEVEDDAERDVEEDEAEEIAQRDVEGAGAEGIADRGIYADEVEEIAQRDVEVEEVQEISARDIDEDEVEEIPDRGIYADEVDDIAERDIEAEEAREITARDIDEDEVEEIEERDVEESEFEEIPDRGIYADEVEEIAERDVEAEEEIPDRGIYADEVEEIEV